MQMHPPTYSPAPPWSPAPTLNNTARALTPPLSGSLGAQPLDLGSTVTEQGIGASSGGVGPDGENLPRGGGEEGGLGKPPLPPTFKSQGRQASRTMSRQASRVKVGAGRGGKRGAGLDARLTAGGVGCVHRVCLRSTLKAGWLQGGHGHLQLGAAAAPCCGCHAVPCGACVLPPRTGEAGAELQGAELQEQADGQLGAGDAG